MFCTKCGSPVGDTAKFCSRCGNKLGEAPAAAPAQPVQTAQPVAQPVQAAPAPAPMPAPQRMRLYLNTDGVTLINYKFEVKDEYGNLRYTAATVTEDLMRQKARLYYPNGAPVFDVFQQAKLTVTALNYDMIMNDQVVTEILQKNKLSKYVYELPRYGITAEGDFISWNFQFFQNGQPVAQVGRKLTVWGDAFELDIYDSNLEMLILAAVMAIELVTIQHRSRRRRR